MRIAEIFASYKKSGPRNTMVTSDFRPEVEIRPFRARACAIHLAITIETRCSLWTRLWGRYHVSQNAYIAITTFLTTTKVVNCSNISF